MKFIRKKKETLEETYWFQNTSSTPLKENIKNLIKNASAHNTLFISSTYTIPKTYYIKCGGYIVEEMIANALSLTNRKRAITPEERKNNNIPQFNELDGEMIYDNTQYSVEIKTYYEKPSGYNTLFSQNQLNYFKVHENSIVILCKFNIINENKDTYKFILDENFLDVLYGNEVLTINHSRKTKQPA